MYRLLKCDRDTYITNKVIAGVTSSDANVGSAGTLNLFKLAASSSILLNNSSSGIEISRGLLHFNLQPIYDLTSSLINMNSSSFKCYLSMKDVYGGDVCPSNYTLSVFPLAKAWTEGRGMDVVAYRDLDAANFITASSNPSLITWAISGAMSGGFVGGTGIDYYTSGSTIGLLECTQSFLRGDEDLYMDVTKLVSGTIAGILPDNGFRLSFTSSQETDSVTRFVKRFGCKNTQDVLLRPKLIVQYNDAIIDDNQMLYFDVTNSLYIYNVFRGISQNFISSSMQITGSNSLVLSLFSSRSLTYITSSYQNNFSASISYLTRSLTYFSQSFSASQYYVGSNPIPGIYYSNFVLPSSNPFYSGSFPAKFKQCWQSIDKTVTYVTGNYLDIANMAGINESFVERNLVVNIINLKNTYQQNEVARLRVFVQDYNAEVVVSAVASLTKPTVFKLMHYRISHAFSGKIIIPFDTVTNSTQLSSDSGGMYFDLYMSDLDVNYIYEIEFEITENGRNFFVTNGSFRFKVIT